MEFSHKPVLLDETIELLNIKENGIYIDGTVGGAGHSSEIAKRLKSGHLYGIDKDPDAILTATQRLKPFQQASVIEGDFRNIKEICQRENIPLADGILLDLGVSSHQLDDEKRGFSYKYEAPLDMRMSQSGVSAKDVINTYSEFDLFRILRDYGEEKFAKRIASFIVSKRQEKEIETTTELADIITQAIPAAARRTGGHPAKKSFQAIRIEVNQELEALKKALEDAFTVLKPGGRLVIITFHSLEDRMVKQSFLDYAKGCTCPPEFPVCVCGKTPRAEILTKKPITASEDELEENNRSHSAKLRGLEKIKD